MSPLQKSIWCSALCEECVMWLSRTTAVQCRLRAPSCCSAPPPPRLLLRLQGNLLIGMQAVTWSCGAPAPSLKGLAPRSSLSPCLSPALSLSPSCPPRAAVTISARYECWRGIAGVEEPGWCATLEAGDLKTERLKGLSREVLNQS